MRPILSLSAEARAATHRPPAVELAGVKVRFGDIVALDVSLTVADGEIVGLLGPSGSGKSTLLRVVAGVTRPDDGTVRLGGIEVAGPGTFIEPERRLVGMVFQDYALFPHLTIAANIGFGLKGDRAAVRDTVTRWLDRLGLSRYAASYPHMLSGGERQRVALARALAPAPRVLLMDEPFSGLDGRLRDRVRRETLQLLRETNTTTIIVTHDPVEALRIGDRVALLRSGRLVQAGPAEEVYARPESPFVAQFLSETNELDAICRQGRVETAIGTFAAPHVEGDVAVRVCVRPHDVRIAEGPTSVAARVVSTEFLGDADWMTLQVDGLDRPLSLRTSSRSGLRPGAPVFLDVDSSSVVVLSADDR
jgi:iron(III) transport system ATP-binding protein